MIRPWDNVPKVAKAQEMVANRLVYGNYKHQYNVVDGNNPDYLAEVAALNQKYAPAQAQTQQQQAPAQTQTCLLYTSPSPRDRG